MRGTLREVEARRVLLPVVAARPGVSVGTSSLLLSPCEICLYCLVLVWIKLLLSFFLKVLFYFFNLRKKKVVALNCFGSLLTILILVTSPTPHPPARCPTCQRGQKEHGPRATRPGLSLAWSPASAVFLGSHETFPTSDAWVAREP